MCALTLTEWETMSGQCYLTKPADLPIELATKYLLVINVATAKKLELNLPWFLEQGAGGDRIRACLAAIAHSRF